jgi:hypothetical protein
VICNVVYDDQLGRVIISATDVTGGSLADVERSLDQVEWVPVRGGTAVTVVGTPPTGSIAPPVSDYEFATQASSFTFPSGSVCPTGSAGIENFYRVRSYYPESMLTVTGSADSRASTPDTASLDITGDIDIRIGVRLEDWTPGTNAATLASKYNSTGDNRSWTFAVNSDGTLLFRWSPDGTFTGITNNSVSSTSAPGFADGSHHAVRVTLDVDNGLGNHVVTFHTAETIAGPWQQLGGTVIRAGTTSIFSGNAAVEVGSINGGVTGAFAGQVMLNGDVTKFEVLNGINGTTVTSPDFTDEQPGTTVFVDAQGLTWTLDTDAIIQVDDAPTEDPVIIDECITSITPGMTDVWLKSIYRPFLNRKIDVLRDFAEVSREFRGGVFPIINRSLPIAVTDLRRSRQWVLGVCTSTAAEATDLDVLLASGDPLFLHVPANSNLPVPSAHIVIDRTASSRKRAYSDKRVWTLPYTEVAAPGDEVIGSVGTWQTVLNTYATWQDVINNHATWADLLTLVGSAEDVIFP